MCLYHGVFLLCLAYRFAVSVCRHPNQRIHQLSNLFSLKSTLFNYQRGSFHNYPAICLSHRVHTSCVMITCDVYVSIPSSLPWRVFVVSDKLAGVAAVCRHPNQRVHQLPNLFSFKFTLILFDYQSKHNNALSTLMHIPATCLSYVQILTCDDFWGVLLWNLVQIILRI